MGNVLIWNGQVAKLLNRDIKLPFYDNILVGNKITTNSSTGLISGGALVADGPATFTMVGGTGQIIDYTTPTAPTIKQITWPTSLSVPVIGIAAADYQYILIDNTGAIVQSTSYPTPQQQRANIFIGILATPDRTTITSANYLTNLAQSPGSLLYDLYDALGFFNITGNAISNNGANLTFQKSSGRMFAGGFNYGFDPQNPSIISIPGNAPVSFVYSTQLGAVGATTTNINPTQYDLGGVLTNVPNGSNATIQRVFMSPNNVVRVQYGQAFYSSLTTALNAINTESFVENPAMVGVTILIGYIVVIKNCTDLSNTNQATFVLAARFDQGAGGGSLAATNLQQAYNNSLTPQIVLNPTNGTLNIFDNATPLGTSLLSVADVTGATKYIDVAASGVTVNQLTVSATNLNSVVFTSATNKITSQPMLDGSILIGRNGNPPNVGNITPGAGITVTNGPASITIASTITQGITSLTGDITGTGPGATATTYNGVVPIAKGGTAAIVSAVAFDNLSPMSTNGDLIYRTGGTNARLPIGTVGQVLTQVGGFPAWSSSSGGGGAGGGSKNYLSVYTASTASGVANTGNGNAELGTTSGWGLGNVATLTNGFPSGAPTFGSGQSGSLLIEAFTGGLQLAQNYSFNYRTTSTMVQGDFLASSAFFIDLEDQAKVLTFKFAYRLASGSAVFAGNSTNTFGVAIYDVTNSAWIQPAGVFNLVQSSGVGISTGTFQTTSNSTQYRFIIYNANSAASAVNLYLDDIFVGPQTSPMAPAMSDWKQYTLVITGSASSPTLGGVQNNTAYYRRIGDSIEIQYDYQQNSVGAAGSGNYLFSLPPGLSIDTSKISSNGFAASGSSCVGTASVLNSAQVEEGYVQVYNTTNLSLTTGNDTSALTTVGSTRAPLSTAVIRYSFTALVPISSWSSNTVSSADTDTRVVAAQASLTSNYAAVTNTVIKFDTVQNDTSASYSTSTGLYTCSVSGFYRVSASLITSSVSGTSYIERNATATAQLASYNSTAVTSGSQTVKCNAGDTLAIFANNGATFLGGSAPSSCTLSIERLSGPSVITATDTVAARYTSAAGQIIPTATVTIVDFGTKDFDTTNSVTTGASWKFTAPVSGKYIIQAEIAYTANGTGDRNIWLYKNGATFARLWYGPNGGGFIDRYINGGTTMSLLAGDSIDIRAQQSTGANLALVASAQGCMVAISRIGN